MEAGKLSFRDELQLVSVEEIIEIGNHHFGATNN